MAIGTGWAEGSFTDGSFASGAWASASGGVSPGPGWAAAWGSGAWAEGAWGEGEDPPAPDPTPKKKGGRVRKKQRYAIDIDGQTFIVGTVAEAQALLRQARELVEESEEIPSKPPTLKVRRISGKTAAPKTLVQAVERTQRALTNNYNALVERRREQRRVDAEISQLMQTKLRLELEEEEAIIALLML